MMTTKENDSSIEIELGSPITKSIIWLHGLGAHGSDFVPIVPELHLPANAGIRFIFPHAPIMPITINNGYQMRAWYDIYSIAVQGEIDKSGIWRAVEDVGKLIENEVKRGVATENILLAGFSQGAVVALITGLVYPKRLAGVLALSGYFPIADEVLAKVSSANRDIPIFYGHGTQDQVVPYAIGEMSYAFLKEGGCNVEWHNYAMAHSVCDQELVDIRAWLKKVLQL